MPEIRFNFYGEPRTLPESEARAFMEFSKGKDLNAWMNSGIPMLQNAGVLAQALTEKLAMEA